MLDAIRPATAADLDQVWLLFEASCALQTPQNPGPNWTLGVYPTRDDFEAHVSAGNLYVGLAGEKVVASMVVTNHDDAEYANVDWRIEVPANKAGVLHLLAVHPSARGRGVASQMLEAAFRIARGHGCEVMHLDITMANHPARSTYERAGFSYAGTYKIFYEDTGLEDFLMFEREL